MTEDFDELDQQIIHTLDTFLVEADTVPYIGNRPWTNRIKELLGELGSDLGYEIATSGFRDRFEREWLYDMVWYISDDERRLLRIPLIMECEWDRAYKQIQFDFEKLLVGNADRRLLICQSRAEDLDGLFAKLKAAVDVFQENGNDRFLFAILDSQTEAEFYYRSYVKRPA